MLVIVAVIHARFMSPNHGYVTGGHFLLKRHILLSFSEPLPRSLSHTFPVPSDRIGRMRNLRCPEALSRASSEQLMLASPRFSKMALPMAAKYAGTIVFCMSSEEPITEIPTTPHHRLTTGRGPLTTGIQTSAKAIIAQTPSPVLLLYYVGVNAQNATASQPMAPLSVRRRSRVSVACRAATLEGESFSCVKKNVVGFVGLWAFSLNIMCLCVTRGCLLQF